MKCPSRVAYTSPSNMTQLQDERTTYQRAKDPRAIWPHSESETPKCQSNASTRHLLLDKAPFNSLSMTAHVSVNMTANFLPPTYFLCPKKIVTMILERDFEALLLVQENITNLSKVPQQQQRNENNQLPAFALKSLSVFF